MEFRAEANILNQEVNAILGQTEACTATMLNANVATAGAVTNITSIKMGDGTDKYVLNTPYGDRTTLITSMTFEYTGDTPPSTVAGTGILTMNLSAHRSVLGSKVLRPRQIAVQVNKTGAGTFSSCTALANMTDGIWQRSMVNTNDIYFNGGNVGIGTANPLTRLHVSAANDIAALLIERTNNATQQASIAFVPAGTPSATNQSWGLGLGVGMSDFFLNSTDGGAVTTRFLVKNNGNVGIGTTNPGYRLHIDSTTGGGVMIHTPPSSGVSAALHLNGNGGNIFRLQGDTNGFSIFDATSVSQRLSISPTGNVGIGLPNPDPNFRLHILGNQKISGGNPGDANIVSLGFYTSAGLRTGYVGDANATNSAMYVGADGANDIHLYAGGFTRLLVESGGNVGIGTPNPAFKLHVEGSVFASTLYANMPSNATAQQVCWTGSGLLGDCASSERFKKNIVDLDVGLESILKMRPVRFQWKENNGREIGFIAEEINLIEPTLVNRDKDGVIMGLKYQEVTPIVVNAIKEIHHRSETQADELLSLKRENTELRQALCDINPSAHICRR